MKDIRLEDLVPFKGHTGQAYKGERLQQLIDSIEKTGLISPIIVRPADNGKYEILCGHNRVKAVRTLGHNTIRADVRYKVSDDMALELFFDSNLNQQSFLDWSYSQRFEAVKYIETLIKETSRQGKRTDLEKETAIGTATLSKYRRIIKLPDNLLRSLEQLLDEKRITFEAAYIIANMIDFDIEILVEGIIKNPDKILDLAILKNLPHRNDEKPGVIYPRSRKRALAALKPRPSSDVIAPVRKTK